MSYSIDYKKRVLEFLEEGGRESEAIKIFKVTHNSIYRWRHATDLRPRYRKQRRRKIDRKALAAHVKKYPHALLRERAAHFGVHPSTISYQLKHMKLVKKTANDMPNDAL
jgi:putative transposase